MRCSLKRNKTLFTFKVNCLKSSLWYLNKYDGLSRENLIIIFSRYIYLRKRLFKKYPWTSIQYQGFKGRHFLYSKLILFQLFSSHECLTSCWSDAEFKRTRGVPILPASIRAALTSQCTKNAGIPWNYILIIKNIAGVKITLKIS